ncbi:hypothetical protein RvY_18216 [Ramazzottius varieornatus]|uniref:G-protein coupled receptors family 2 profile 2 domain-containing protein n=1 Tax=Ramazzottius varieornatus TaxID=947166 RepID=A0A1D1W6N8_RAMVA|nr:hypothetical protein RvY_18216 [Ramazzottius varieornatus]
MAVSQWQSRHPQNQSEQIRISSEKEFECRHQTDLDNLVNMGLPTTAESATQHWAFCPREWDLLACWPPTLPNATVNIPCPDYVQGFHPHGFASRFCTENGTWAMRFSARFGEYRNWSNYSQCYNVSSPINVFSVDNNLSPTTTTRTLPHQESLHHIRLMAVTGYTVSLISLVAAVAILLAFKRLHNGRNILHINLFLSYIFRAIATMIARNDIETEPGSLLASTDYYNTNGVACRFLTSVLHYALMANYFWIFVEGFYLNNVISSIFKDHSKPWIIRLYIVGGWFPPFLFVLTWALVRQIHYNTQCWLTHETAQLKQVFWIMRGPITATIVMNLLFFLNIARILLKQFQLRAALSEDESSAQKLNYIKYRKMAKATLVLLALYGIHFFVLIFVAAFSISTEAEIIWLATDQFFSSFQGLLASILFCFANGEVRSEMAKVMYHHTGRSFGSMRRTSSHLSNHTRIQTAQCTRQNSLVRPAESIRLEPQHAIYSPLPKDTFPPCTSQLASPPSYESLCLTHCHTANNSDDETEDDQKRRPTK